MTVKKKASSLFNMVFALFAITLIAGISLGYVNELTLEPKARARLERKVNALKNVLPAFTNSPVDEAVRLSWEGAPDSLEFYPAMQDSTLVGVAVTGGSEKGYNGTVRLLVGFNPDGSIRNIAVLEQKETPGLGTKMKGEAFLKQFREQDPATFDLRVRKDGGQVDALAGATISTRAFAEAVQQAYEVYRSQMEGRPNQTRKP